MYLLKHHNCRIKQGVENSNICEVSSAFKKLSHSSRAAIRSTEIGKVVLVMFQFKLRKKSRIGLTWNLRSTPSDYGTVRKKPAVCLATLSSAYTSVVRRHKKQISHKSDSNIFHENMLYATKDPTGHTVMGARSRHSHKWLTRNVAAHLWPSFKLPEFI